MSKARFYARNLLANWVGHGANLIVLLLLSPFVVHTVGKELYGIWSLLTVIIGYMGILDIGVRASTGRHIILYLGREEHDRVEDTVRTSAAFFSAISVIIMAASLAIAWVFPYVFRKVSPEHYGLVRLLLPIVAANVWLAAYGAIYASVLVAHERFDMARTLDLVVLAVRVVLTVLLLKAELGLLGLAIAMSVCNVFALGGNFVLSHRIYPRLRTRPRLSKERLRELMSYGIPAFISNISIKIIGQTDLIIVGLLLNVEAVTVYSVGAMLVYYSATFMGKISATFFPPVQRAVARGEMGPARWLFMRQVRLNLTVGLPVFLGFIVFSSDFIRLWMLGNKFDMEAVHLAAGVMGILSGSKLLDLFAASSGSFLDAMGYVRFSATVTLIEAAVNLGLSVFFVMVFQWGLAGVAAGTLFARLLVRAFIMPRSACRRARMNWHSYLYQVYGKGVLAGLLILGWFCAVHWAMRVENVETWPGFLLAVFVALLGCPPVAFIFLMPQHDRHRVLRLLKLRPARDT